MTITMKPGSEIKKATENESAPLKETEGPIVVGLYYHLWKKNGQGESCNVSIPDTVIIQNGSPISWYFTSSKDNKLMRKKKSSMQGPVMADAFMAGRDSLPELCAWFTGNMIKMENSKTAHSKAHSSAVKLMDNEPDLEEMPMEYLSHERVQGLLDPGPYRLVPEQMYDGMMQKFVEAREPKDFIIRVTWCPKACVFEKRANKHRLVTFLNQESAEARHVTDRIASFTGPMWLHDHVTLKAGTLSSRLFQQCNSVVQHLKEVSQGQTIVKHMQLLFKVDVHNRDPTKEEEVQLIEEEKGYFQCAMTGNTCPRSQRIEVTYKLIMQHWFSKCAELAAESDRIHALDCIPPAIRRANPNMTRDYYLRYRSQPFFLLSLTNVCPEAEAELSRTPCDVPSCPGMATLAGPRPATASSASRSRPLSGAVVIPLSTGRLTPTTPKPCKLAGEGAGAGYRLTSATSLPLALLPKAPLQSAASLPLARPTSPLRAARAASPWSMLPPARPQSPVRQQWEVQPVVAQRPAVSPCRPSLSPMPNSPQGRSSPCISTPSPEPRWPANPSMFSTPADASSSPLTTIREEAAGLHHGVNRASAPGRAGVNCRQARRPRTSDTGNLSGDIQGLGDTMHSSTSMGSRRSRQSQILSGDDLKTLKELSEAYSQAEQLTASLLEQAHSLLQGMEPPAVPASSSSGQQQQVPMRCSMANSSRLTQEEAELLSEALLE